MNNSFSGTLKNCFDSHVHWRATGQVGQWVSLKELQDLKQIDKIPIHKFNYAGPWLIGFGWNEMNFVRGQVPTRQILDQVFGETPVCFSRIDGHSIWVNTAALKIAGIFKKNVVAPEGGKIEIDELGYPSGILIDQATLLIHSKIPTSSIASVKRDLLFAQGIFHRAGITHIRDLTCNELQWLATFELQKNNELKMHVDQFFNLEGPEKFSDCIKLIQETKKISSPYIKVRGLKVYFDGALGSESALLSEQYSSCSGHGLQLLSLEFLEQVMYSCAQHEIDLAVHTIGDRAARMVVQLAYELSQKGVSVQLHLEHVELLDDVTVSLLGKISVTCHMQPSHWLSDKKWLGQKIGRLNRYAFRWRELESNGVKIFFGSDSPIEPTSMRLTKNAIYDAELFGISKPLKEFWQYHQYTHADTQVIGQTTFLEDQLVQVKVNDDIIDLKI